jgi:hypothetical protein
VAKDRRGGFATAPPGLVTAAGFETALDRLEKRAAAILDTGTKKAAARRPKLSP